MKEEFVVPRCRTVNLAQDLIESYNLGMDDGQLLRNKIVPISSGLKSIRAK